MFHIQSVLDECSGKITSSFLCCNLLSFHMPIAILSARAQCTAVLDQDIRLEMDTDTGYRYTCAACINYTHAHVNSRH